MRRLIIIGILFMAVPASGQLPGDLTCNGFAYEIADAVLAMRILVEGCSWDSIPQCTLDNGDIDGDGYSLTISDILRLSYWLNGDPNIPDFPHHPESDTIRVESAIASPGESLALPVYIKTVDTLTAFEFYIIANQDYITIDSLIAIDDHSRGQSDCWGNIFAYSFYLDNPILLLPGAHHIADLNISVNPDIDYPVTTELIFSDNPDFALYTGFANLTFFLPVMINAEIQIIPTGTDEGMPDNFPKSISISIHPNPFNSHTNIAVSSKIQSELAIYDILGREIRTFPVNPGENQFRWDAIDRDGKPVVTGIYFTRIKSSAAGIGEKLLYLR